MLFTLKKIISAFMIFPGIIILILAASVFLKEKKKIRAVNIFLIAVLYLMSVNPVANFFIRSVEKKERYAGKPAADVYILLGGGVIRGDDDISGKNMPVPDMVVRIVDTARLYKLYKKPIIFTGGSLSPGSNEAEVVKRYLIDLGVSGRDILLEDKSLDTVENAEYTKIIMDKNKFKKAVLVTSAFHMKRSELIFKRYGYDIVLNSAGSYSENKNESAFMDFLPDIHELRKTTLALRESIGYLFYKFQYTVRGV